MKRKFLDCEDDEEARGIVGLINKLYQEDHKHEIGIGGWTAQKNLRWRREYAPRILKEIRERLDRMKADPEMLPKSDRYNAVHYMLNEWDAIENIFTKGNYHLDKGGTAMLITSWRVPACRKAQQIHIALQKELAFLRFAQGNSACRHVLLAGLFMQTQQRQLLRVCLRCHQQDGVDAAKHTNQGIQESAARPMEGLIARKASERIHLRISRDYWR